MWWKKEKGEQHSPSHVPGKSPLRVVVSSGIVHWVAVIQDKIRLVSLGAGFWKAGWAWQWLKFLGTFAAVHNEAHPLRGVT